MAIEHSLLIKGNMVPLDRIIQFCENKGIHYEVQSDTEIYLDKWGMNVWSWARPKGRNVWDSNLFGEDFSYEAEVAFRLGKDPDYSEEQKAFVLDFMFDITKEIKQEALFLYCSDMELCLFKADGSVQINDKYSILRDYIKRTQATKSIAAINEYLAHSNCSDFRINYYDGARLYLMGSMDLCYYSEIEILFEEVGFLSMDTSFNLWDLEKAPFKLKFGTDNLDYLFEVQIHDDIEKKVHIIWCDGVQVHIGHQKVGESVFLDKNIKILRGFRYV